MSIFEEFVSMYDTYQLLDIDVCDNGDCFFDMCDKDGDCFFDVETTEIKKPYNKSLIELIEEECELTESYFDENKVIIDEYTQLEFDFKAFLRESKLKLILD